MKLIDSYILKTVLKAILLTLLVLTVLSFVLALIEELDDVGRGDYGFVDALIVAASATPRFIYQAFPLSSLIGALLGMGGMANSGELTAMRAAGMSTSRIVYAVLKAGLLLLLLVVAIGDGLGPPLELYGDQLRQQRMNRQITFNSRHGFWAKDVNAFVNVKSMAPGGKLRHLTIYRLSPEQKLEEITAAAWGVYENGRWVLRQARRSVLYAEHVETRTYKQLDWDSSVNPAVLSAALINPMKLPVWDLYYQMQSLEQRGQNAINYAVAFWGKFAVPLTTLGMLILALPMVMGASRSISAGQRIFAGILLGSLFFLVNRGFSFGVIVWNLPPVTVVFFPVVLFALLFIAISRWAPR